MKVHDLGRDCLGGRDEIAFVFAVFRIDDDDHLAASDGIDGRLHGGKSFGHR
jgi:hypothetical protein